MPVKLSSMANRLAPLATILADGGRVISLDTSSSCTGAAVFECGGGPSPRLIHAARLQAKPKNRPAYERIDQIVDQALALVETYHVDLAINETTTGKTSSRHSGHGAGLAIYGVAVGAVRQAMKARLGKQKVIDVLENDWTQRTTKLDRWYYCKASYPSFAGVWKADDGDYDASDAAYLFYWCEQVCEYAAQTAGQASL